MNVSRFLFGAATGVWCLASLDGCAAAEGSSAPREAARSRGEAVSAATCGERFVASGGDDAGGGNDCGDKSAPCGSLQRAVDAACAGDVVHVGEGVFAGNVVITTPLTLRGRGSRTRLVPAVSAPNPCDDSSLCGGLASSVVLVRSPNVTIEEVTVDGDNPGLTSGVVRGGADIDARNGIITDADQTGFDDLVVRRVRVVNVFWRGIYAASGGSFRFEDDVVENVQGDAMSVAVFNWEGSGVVTRTVVTAANDAISSNHGRGVTLTENLVIDAASGLHSDNSGDSSGSSPDLIAHNAVYDCRAKGYGVWAFIPYSPIAIRDNLVVGCDVGLALFGQGAPVETAFERNVVIGTGDPQSLGAVVTNDQLGYGTANATARFEGNDITHTGTGIALLEHAGYVTDVALACNAVRDNGVGIDTATASGSIHDNDIEHNGVGLQATTPDGDTVDARDNYWGCHEGPASAGCDTVTGPVDASDPDGHAPRCARRHGLFGW